MAYPSRPENQIRRTFGLSIPGQDAERLDALIESVYPGMGHRKRSEFIVATLFEALATRWGPRWREIADQLMRQQEAERAALAEEPVLEMAAVS